MSLQLQDPDLLKHQAYIDGEWVDADDGDTVAVINPADGNTVCGVARCGRAETHRAIEAAETAQREWRRTTAKERSVLMRRWFDLMMAAQPEF